MSHFEIWYAVQAGGKYVHFNKDKDTLEQFEVFYEDFFEGIVELAISLVTQHKVSSAYVFTETDGSVASVSGNPTEYVALIEDAKISSIMDFALANCLYEDQSSLRQVILKPITRCDKCRIMYVNGVFYWDYVSETRGRQSASAEQVLAKVCIPTAGYGDKQHIPCLAKQLHEADLGLLQKTPAELHDFVRANNNAIEFELPDEDYYLAMAKEIRDGQVKFNVGQQVRFSTQASVFEVYSHYAPNDGSERQYYLKSVTTPSYLQWALESDLSDAT
ncbi:hypothetical protein Pam2_147 [Pseudanabaena phage Pam2]|nr:hypothetical protein Pam2_147 [Pseudanabaena phage Pam2]